MRSIRTLVAALGVLAVLVAGCTSGSSSADNSPASAAQWVGRQDGVDRAAAIPYDDPAAGSFVRVTLDSELSDAAVHDVVHGIKKHFDGTDDRPSFEVDVDGFRASVFPALLTYPDGVDDPDLERALWLRADGRATGYGLRDYSGGSAHPLVTAPSSVVAALAIDYDAAVTHEHDGRRTESVESIDGTTGVQWTTAASLGFGMDTNAVGEFARLQDAYPGTTGWVDCGGRDCKAAIHFARADVPVRRVASGKLVDSSLFTTLGLGWGPARTPDESTPAPLAKPAVQRLVADLGDVPGVVALTEFDVVVSNRAAFDRVRRYVVRSGSRVDIDLLRTPVLYDYSPDPVFTSGAGDPAGLVSAYSAVADLPGVVALTLARRSDFGNLTVDHRVTGAELRTTFRALAALPSPYRVTNVYGTRPGAVGRYGAVTIGQATPDGFERAAPTAKGVPEPSAAFVKRVALAWRAVRAR